MHRKSVWKKEGKDPSPNFMPHTFLLQVLEKGLEKIPKALQSQDWKPWTSRSYTLFLILSAREIETNRTTWTTRFFLILARREVLPWVLISNAMSHNVHVGAGQGTFVQTHEISNIPFPPQFYYILYTEINTYSHILLIPKIQMQAHVEHP